MALNPYSRFDQLALYSTSRFNQLSRIGCVGYPSFSLCSAIRTQPTFVVMGRPVLPHAKAFNHPVMLGYTPTWHYLLVFDKIVSFNTRGLNGGWIIEYRTVIHCVNFDTRMKLISRFIRWNYSPCTHSVTDSFNATNCMVFENVSIAVNP